MQEIRSRHFRSGLIVALSCTFMLAAAPADPPVADAAMKGDIEAVRSLLKQGADVNAAQGDGMTALHWAAQRGDVEVEKVLIYAGANIRATTRLGAYTPLLLASRVGHAAAIRTLLEAGADPNTPSATGAMPLHLAAASGKVDAVAALLADVPDILTQLTQQGAIMWA
jgi:ankyrin repeat protein